MNCKHENVTFRGVFSMIGCYVCDDCGEEFDPVEYHRMTGEPHVDLKVEDYAPDFREKIANFWADRQPPLAQSGQSGDL